MPELRNCQKEKQGMILVDTLLSENVYFGKQMLSNYLNVNTRTKLSVFFPYSHVKKQEKKM